MRQAVKVSSSVVLSLVLAVSLLGRAKKEYLTEDELDLIRDAQELNARVHAYFKLAERRLIFLGVMEKSEQEKEKDRKQKEKLEKQQKKSIDTKATSNKAPVDDTAYLDTFSSAELLRGYIQTLDEVMTNIDDNYNRKLDVRDSLEDLVKFTGDTVPLLQKFQPKNNADRNALQDAISKANEAQTQAREALKVVPKTEKKRK